MPSPNFTPLHNYLIVEKAEQETARHGILLPDNAKSSAPLEGIVLNVGPGKYDGGNLVPMTVKVGDRVMFEKGEARPITLDGLPYILLSEDSIYGIMG